jgi:hypothetical protein
MLPPVSIDSHAAPNGGNTADAAITALQPPRAPLVLTSTR